MEQSATGPASISSVQFFLDGVAFGSAVTSLPYSASWNTNYGENGQHTLTALALDTYGDETSSTIGFNLIDPGVTAEEGGGPYISPSTPPAVSATSTSSTAASSSVSLNTQLEQLQALFSSLVSEVKNSGGSSSSGAQGIFTRDLTVGSRGSDVTELQSFLIAHGVGVSASALASIGPTGYFGLATQSALGEYQASVSIKPAVGYFGPITRAYINALDK